MLSVFFMLVCACVSGVACSKRHSSEVFLDEISTPRLTSGDAKLSFPTRKEMEKVLMEIKGKPVSNVIKRLGSGAAMVSVSRSGGLSDMKTTVEEMVTSRPVIRGEYDILYEIVKPEQGTLLLTVRDGIVVDARFLVRSVVDQRK